MKKPGRGQRPREQSRPKHAAVAETPRAAPPPPAAPAAAPPRNLADRLIELLPLSALIVVAVFAIRRLDDFDTWWHLASGRWIVRNRSIPDTDVLSFTVPQNEWINLQWLYDVLIYGVHQLGGASALVLLSAFSFVLTFVLLARHLGRYVGPIPATLLLIWVAATVNERFLIRPEMASFPLLAAVQLVIAEGRANARVLRWLVPLMVLWANMHSLFILGVAAIGCAIAGAVAAELPVLPRAWRRDSAWPKDARRELFVWGGAAVAATLLNPYFVRAILFPLELMTRIDGSSEVYGVIGEFRPPFSGYFPTFAIGSYQVFVFTFAGLAVVAGIVRAAVLERRREEFDLRRPGFDLGMLAFAAALAYLSLLARRNVGIFAIGAVPFVGASLGVLLALLPRTFPAPAVVRASSAVVLAGALWISGMVVSNQWYASTGETHEFGLGTFESNFHPRACEFFRENGLPGPTFNDMTAGGYLTWNDPSGKGVYVDGRLEVYDTAFFGAYLDSLSNIQQWKKDADARGVQSVTVFHRWGNRHGFIRALQSLPDWRIVYYDETVATFVRATENAELIGRARESFTKTWRPRVDAELGAPPRTYRWQWAIDRYTGMIAYARLLETLGDGTGALAWFEKAIALGLPPEYDVETRQRAAQYYARAGQLAQARRHLEKALESDPSDENTRAMLSRLDGLQR